MENIKDKLAVLVVSCDEYSDLWKPFFDCFNWYWPDCPFNVYLLSNKKTWDRVSVKNILTGDDLSWSDSLYAGVCQLHEEYILLFLDDLFLCSRVNTIEIVKLVNWAVKSKVNYLRMNPTNNRADKPYNSNVGMISKKGIYRASTVLSMWRKTLLLSLLKSGETAWDFEVGGSVRSDAYNDFYAAWQNNFQIINGVIKGKWSRKAVSKLITSGININFNARKIMTKGEEYLYCLRQIRSYCLSLFPAKYRRLIRNILIG